MGGKTEQDKHGIALRKSQWVSYRDKNFNFPSDLLPVYGSFYAFYRRDATERDQKHRYGLVWACGAEKRTVSVYVQAWCLWRFFIVMLWLSENGEDTLSKW